MGSRVSKEEVTLEHFYLKRVCTKNQYNKQLLVSLIPLLRNDQYSDWERLQPIVKRMDTDAIMIAESFEKEEIKKSFTCFQCPSEFQLAINYERFDFVLATEVKKKKQMKKFYSEEELFFILYQLLGAAKQFQQQNMCVGDIRPFNIAVTYREQIKMITTATLPYECTAVDKVIDGFNTTDIFYFAPEEVDFIAAKGYSANEEYPNPKTEAFSIGLTVLDTALLESSEELYEMPSRKINEQELTTRIKKVGEKFNKLHSHLWRILRINSIQRLNSGEAWARLKPYSESISILKNFHVDLKKEDEYLQIFRGNGFRKSKK